MDSTVEDGVYLSPVRSRATIGKKVLLSSNDVFSRVYSRAWLTSSQGCAYLCAQVRAKLCLRSYPYLPGARGRNVGYWRFGGASTLSLSRCSCRGTGELNIARAEYINRITPRAKMAEVNSRIPPRLPIFPPPVSSFPRLPTITSALPFSLSSLALRVHHCSRSHWPIS